MQLPWGLYGWVCGLLCGRGVQGGDVEWRMREERSGLHELLGHREGVPKPSMCRAAYLDRPDLWSDLAGHAHGRIDGLE